MKRLTIIVLAAVTVLITMNGCTNDTCGESRTTLPLAGLYNSQGVKTAFDSLAVYGIGGAADSAIVALPGTRITQLYLPMQPGTDRTTWVISYKQKALDHPELNDTMTLAYTSSPYFASSECGVVMHYRLTSFAYTRHLVDSIAVTDSLFNNYDFERIKIMFRTADSDDNEPEADDNTAQS